MATVEKFLEEARMLERRCDGLPEVVEQALAAKDRIDRDRVIMSILKSRTKPCQAKYSFRVGAGIMSS